MFVLKATISTKTSKNWLAELAKGGCSATQIKLKVYEQPSLNKRNR